MDRKELKRKSREYLIKRGFKPFDKVYAVIDGKHMMLDEFEVRYLQTQCMLADDFDEFCKRVVIYAGPNNTYEQMKWKVGGRFETSFASGFFDKIGVLCIELSRHERGMVDVGTFNLY